MGCDLQRHQRAISRSQFGLCSNVIKNEYLFADKLINLYIYIVLNSLYVVDWRSFKNVRTDKNFVGSRVGYNFSEIKFYERKF
jgi:hypothetical protein